MSVEFRPYRKADKPACLALFESNTPPFFDPSERPLFDVFLDEPEGAYFVLEQEGRLLGCGGFIIDPPADAPVARFSWGMVDRSSHGDGLGRALTEHRLAEIRRIGGIASACLATTPMIAPFFAHMGFVQGKVIEDGFAQGLDKVEMRMEINPTAL